MSNNKVLELTTAFLNSFRVHNISLPLCMIPYSEDFDQIESLKEIYNFSIFTDLSLLKVFDDISIKFHGNIVGSYRRMAAWEGSFEQFIYIDIDTIVLENLSFVWKNLSHCKFFTSHSNLPQIRKWVWKDSIYKKNKLNRSQIEYSANCGFIVSTKKILPTEWIISRVDEALEFKDDMELFCMEQPFLNYLIVTSGYNYGSLLQFHKWNSSKGLQTDLKFEFWAGLSGGKIKKGKFKAPNQLPIFLVHWAGVWRENNGDLSKIPYQKLWEYYRNLDPLSLPRLEG